MSTESLEQTAETGEWITPQVSYVNPQRIACAMCGRPIPRRYWVSADLADSHPFCEPSHATLYRTYWLPTHGKSPTATP